MAFIPAATLLLTTDELKNFSFDITYEVEVTPPPEGGGTGEPTPTVVPVVTVEAVTPLPTVTVLNNGIAGYFKDSFNYSVNYIDSQQNDYSVNKFSQIDINKLHELYKYTPNMNRSVDYTYIATAKDSTTNAVIATQTYTITVTENWTTGKNELKKYLNYAKYYQDYVVSWLGAAGQPVVMVNNLGAQVLWEKI